MEVKRNANLRTPTPEQAREYGRRGGYARADKIKNEKTIRSAMEWFLEQKFDAETDKEKAIANKFPDLTWREALAVAAVGKATQGDTRAAVFVRDTVGETPKKTVSAEQDDPFEIKITTIL